MDMLVEEEDSPYVVEEEPKGFTMVNPITFVLAFLEQYGWYLLGASVLLAYLVVKLRPVLERWQQSREDAAYHKDPDMALARMEAIQRARERQQRLLEEASLQALQEQQQREERKREEALRRLQQYGSAAGHKLGASDEDYLPLSGGAASSSYRPPKRSACSQGGCGR